MESRLTENRATLRRWLAIAACVASSAIVWREAAADGVLEGGAVVAGQVPDEQEHREARQGISAKEQQVVREDGVAAEPEHRRHEQGRHEQRL